MTINTAKMENLTKSDNTSDSNSTTSTLNVEQGNQNYSSKLLLPAFSEPMQVFLSPRYRFLNLHHPLAPLSQEEIDERQGLLVQLRAQRSVERFFQEGCVLRAVVMGIGGGFLGLLFGAFFYTMRPLDVIETEGMTFRQQVRHQFKNFIPDVSRTSKNFAKVGAVYALTECIIQRERGRHDLSGAVYAGCTTGALLAYKGGPTAMAGGCVAFGLFSAVMESLDPFAHLGG